VTQPENSTNFDDGMPAFNSSFESDWFTAVTNAKVATTPYSGSFYAIGIGPELDDLELFSKPQAGTSTLLLRMKYPDGFSAFTDDANVAVVGQYYDRGRANEEGYVGGDWMVLPNRDEADGVATAIDMVTDVTNDIGSGNYKFSTVDVGAHWFDTMGCTRFAVLITNAADVGVQSGSVSVQGKFL
jgi:hypothetical protein